MIAQIKKPIEIPVEESADISTGLSKRYSVEEYLAIEVESESRNEYRDGEIVPMAGGLPNHNQIAGNIYATFNFAFRGKPLQAFITDQRLWIPKKRTYTYPDVMVIQGQLELQPRRKDTVMNPVMIVEVLSKSTADYDREKKFRAYRTIPSFQEYVLIDQYSQHIDQYVKVGTKKWNLQEYDETDTVVRLVTIDLEVAIADIYDKVKFEIEAEVSE